MRYFSNALTALAMLGAVAQAQAAPMTNQYEELSHRLLAGLPTTSIVDLDRCKVRPDPPGKNPVSSGLTVGHVIKDFKMVPGPHAMIAYNQQRLITGPSNLPILEVFEYGVMPDDKAIVTMRELSPKTYRQLSEPINFLCQVGTALRFEPATGIMPADKG
ncbi:hypothetical protein [Phyllobacterium leguminum]|uniref:VirK protein n=1 Tax=Phyllobacterium leguminum TaxID=314237 RepID=A0A318TAE3_9HYPH|nr:hypothetical protein [Phyllobacterium leguminum]PYE89996.1 VirK protein [Phyllobacterium leguminum]